MIAIRKFIPHRADCYTLLCDFYERCYGIELPRYEYDSVKQEKPPDQVWEDWRIIAEAQARPGDVILTHSDLGIHVGIVLDNGEYLHSTCISNPPIRINKISDFEIRNSEKENPQFLRYRTIDEIRATVVI